MPSKWQLFYVYCFSSILVLVLHSVITSQPLPIWMWTNRTSYSKPIPIHMTVTASSNNTLSMSTPIRNNFNRTEEVNKSSNQTQSQNQRQAKGKLQPKITDYKQDTQYKQYMKCPSSIRHTMGNSSVLASLYRQDVPILLSKGDLNPSEYTRLKPFTNMMGWKEVNYTDVADALSVLNTPNNKYLFDDRMVNGTVPDGCITCAVVASGGILNGSRKGQEIDSHDYVFRVNAAFTKNYSRDVGNKTSFYCFGMVTLYHTLRKYKKSGLFAYPPWNTTIRYVFMPDGYWAYKYIYAVLANKTLPKRGKWEPPEFRHPLRAEEIKLIHPDFSRYLEKSLVQSRHKAGRITTGGLMLLLALHTCDKVDAYGFMGDPTKYSHYYYDKKFTPYSWKIGHHDWFSENKLWEKFIKAGVLNMYTRDNVTATSANPISANTTLANQISANATLANASLAKPILANAHFV